MPNKTQVLQEALKTAHKKLSWAMAGSQIDRIAVSGVCDILENVLQEFTLAARQAQAGKAGMTDDFRAHVRNVFLSHGFKLKDQGNGVMDLNPYVYDAAHALLRSAPQAAEQKEQDSQWTPLSIDEAHLRLHQAINNIKFGNKTDDKLIVAELRKMGFYIAGRAALSAQDEQQVAQPVAWTADSLYDAIKNVLEHYRLSNFVDEEGGAFPLVDHLSKPGTTIATGKDEITFICDEIYNSVLTALPPPPSAHTAVSEQDRTDAKRYRWLRSEHDVISPIARVSWKMFDMRESSNWGNIIDSKDLDKKIDFALSAKAGEDA